MSLGLSIVICTYNGSKRLPKTLDHLVAQQVPQGIPWEVIVIDNASTDDTAETALRYKAAMPLRVVKEPVAGKSNALVRGVREAQHGIISIIDDDNWVASDWVKRVNAIFEQHPEIDFCGGRSEAVYEIEPPFWLENIDGLKGFYAIGSQYEQNGDITNSSGTLLWGAGSTMRTSSVRKLLVDGFTFKLISRKGTRLSSSGDTELCFALREAGCRFWYDDDLVLSHFIPKERLQWKYALRLMRAMGKSSIFIELYLIAFERAPFNNRPAWKRSWLFAMLKASRLLGRVILHHPLDCYRRTEGSPNALYFKRHLGRWGALWRLLGRYKTIREDLQHSPWVHVKTKSRTRTEGMSKIEHD